MIESKTNLDAPVTADVIDAYKQGCKAVQAMAKDIERLFAALDRLADSSDLKMRHLLAPLRFTIEPAMQALGDLLNAGDADADESDANIDEAFEKVKAALEKHYP